MVAPAETTNGGSSSTTTKDVASNGAAAAAPAPAPAADAIATTAATASIDQAQVPVPLMIKKLSDKARLPTRGSAFAAGYDLYAARDTTVPARGKVLVETDIAMAVPAGTCKLFFFL